MSLKDELRAREEVKRKPHHCDRCVWGDDVGTTIVCKFDRCIRDNGWSVDRKPKPL